MEFKQVCAASCLTLVSSVASAVMITQVGDNVSFTYDNATAYGEGTVLGDVIFFNPTAFRAESTDLAGAVSVSETLILDVTATTASFSMSSFSLSENGDYRVSGSTASVTANGFLQATSLTGLCGSSVCQDTALFSGGPFAQTGSNIALWDMGGTLNLADTVGWGSDTSVRLTIQNNLESFTNATGDTAWIQKKFSVTIPAVPVPAAVWLFGSGLLGLVAVARRKAKV
jgi:hypothetical protein